MWGPKARINKKFLDNLANEFGHKEFTTHGAEWLYLLYHCDDIKRNGFEEGKDYYWPKANARANLAIATERGILVRVRRGVYKFNK